MNFWDSSALLPLLVEESTSKRILAFYRQQPEILAAWSTTVECVSALGRLEREGRLESRAVTQAIRQLRELQEAWHEVQPIEPVRQMACRLLRVHPLRAADSMQLASAMIAAGSNAKDWGFVCLDTRLSEAAEREGFNVLSDFS
jgi:predicted nucleic acid-binding protein